MPWILISVQGFEIKVLKSCLLFLGSYHGSGLACKFDVSVVNPCYALSYPRIQHFQNINCWDICNVGRPTIFRPGQALFDPLIQLVLVLDTFSVT